VVAVGVVAAPVEQVGDVLVVVAAVQGVVARVAVDLVGAAPLVIW
jgi:hypothetical protein